ncbi:MAG: enoyl-CoA hydratase/isomerase family protein [Acidobacteriota bacterium]|nr:enoyl-CoA hydratase/isomerase family protein [Acidobacteriota bacterium]
MSSESSLPRQIRKAAVLGAGTMGSRIAAHLANAGLPVVLLDMAPPGTATDAGSKDRSRFAVAALENLRKAKPAATYAPEALQRITPGNFDDHLPLLADCDWVIEAVAEDLAIKHALLTRVQQQLGDAAILTTNTSGLPIQQIAECLAPGVRRRFFGTHFFNPPRYMRLLEVIATSESDRQAMALVSAFCDERLGKSIVMANDTPNFIANRVGTFAMLNAIRLMMQQGLSIEEVDVLTGTAIGWPRTGTFRLGDMVGIDILAHVAENFSRQAAALGDERADVALPEFVRTMLTNRWLGDKTQQGFYKKGGRDEQGREVRLVLDWHTLEYKAASRPKFATLEMVKPVDSAGARVAQLLQGDPRSDKAAAFYRPFLTELFTYAANRLPPQPNAIAADVFAIDTALRTGFNWELGPFELFDAAGVRAVTDAMRAQGQAISPNVERLLAHGESWYQDDAAVPSGRRFFDAVSGTMQPVQVPAGVSSFAIRKKANGVVARNPGASLIDLGDGVAGLELHSKMNALGDDIVRLITQTLRPGSQAVADFEAFVLSGDSANFSVGANLMQLLLTVQEEEWDEVELAVRAFQGMTQAIKFCPRPVVVAPYGMCLGGGVEIALHAAARQPHAELYMGLVEAGVGLIPGGGGTKEMLLRALEAGTSIRPDARGEGVEIFEAVKKHFELIAKATVSTSAAEARSMNYLREADQVTMNRSRLLCDAVARARQLVAAGYSAPMPRTDLPAPGESVLATLKLAVWTMREAEYISDHDMKVANWAATVLAGGNVAAGTLVSEQYLLDLEREAFLSLCGEKKTQERIAFTLKTGKPLRN